MWLWKSMLIGNAKPRHCEIIASGWIQGPSMPGFGQTIKTNVCFKFNDGCEYSREIRIRLWPVFIIPLARCYFLSLLFRMSMEIIIWKFFKVPLTANRHEHQFSWLICHDFQQLGSFEFMKDYITNHWFESVLKSIFIWFALFLECSFSCIQSLRPAKIQVESYITYWFQVYEKF